ncbi:MAG: hypothetical protein ABL864_12670 [Terricaulis sp.]
MKHGKIIGARAWRAPNSGAGRYGRLGVLTALAFNFCLVLLALASATALGVVARDQLYAYEYSEGGARAIARRVERLNSDLIQLDFDRQNQWDDLVAMELMARDVAAARGFLLSARAMLPPRAANQISRAAPANAGDAQVELAALELLTPGTRGRYEATVPLLSRRAASGAAVTRVPDAPAPGDPRDFELIARALIADPSTGSLQFILTGFSLGLAGEFTPRAARGAEALIEASRRDDYPSAFGVEVADLISASVPIDGFRVAARAGAQGEAIGAYDNAAAAFRAAVNPARAARVREMLEEIGAMSEASSHATAVALITHANQVRDLPKLRLIAQSAGDRAAAAAKRLQRDGRLLHAAHGELTFTRDLTAAIAVAAAALAGLIFMVAFKAYQTGRRVWLRLRDDDDGEGELVDLSSNWRPL